MLNTHLDFWHCLPLAIDNGALYKIGNRIRSSNTAILVRSFFKSTRLLFRSLRLQMGCNIFKQKKNEINLKLSIIHLVRRNKKKLFLAKQTGERLCC